MGVEAEAADLLNTLSGAELLQAMAEHRFPRISDLHERIGQVVTAAEPGRIELAWTPHGQMCNPGGTVHGGYIAMILDNAVCMAGSTTLDRFVPMITLNLNIDYLRGVRADETYTVIGTCVHPGRTRLVANAVVTDPAGRPVAQASASVLPNRDFGR